MQKIISRIENTFSKDDVTSAPRAVLEQLIVSVYEDLTELNKSVQS